MTQKSKKMGTGIGLLAAAVLAFSVFKNQKEAEPGLNRAPEQLVLSEHAKCRMACREIDLGEVKEILKEGRINKRKSRLDDANYCLKRYALEGRTRDQQQVRIIFASCGDRTTVITAIDLGADPDCYCP